MYVLWMFYACIIYVLSMNGNRTPSGPLPEVTTRIKKRLNSWENFNGNRRVTNVELHDWGIGKIGHTIIYKNKKLFLKFKEKNHFFDANIFIVDSLIPEFVTVNLICHAARSFWKDWKLFFAMKRSELMTEHWAFSRKTGCF